MHRILPADHQLVNWLDQFSDTALPPGALVLLAAPVPDLASRRPPTA
jgi:hypothetical protein